MLAQLSWLEVVWQWNLRLRQIWTADHQEPADSLQMQNPPADGCCAGAVVGGSGAQCWILCQVMARAIGPGHLQKRHHVYVLAAHADVHAHASHLSTCC